MQAHYLVKAEGEDQNRVGAEEKTTTRDFVDGGGGGCGGGDVYAVDGNSIFPFHPLLNPLCIHKHFLSF